MYYKIENIDMVLERIINIPNAKVLTFIILGKSGPTGKTWLHGELKSRGLNAIEISEQICSFVGYETYHDENYITTTGLDNQVVIILNKRLK